MGTNLPEVQFSAHSKVSKGSKLLLAGLLFIACLFRFAPRTNANFEEKEKQAPPYKVLSSTAFPELSNLFMHENGWTGADAAYSVLISPNLSLWLFGDTWIGQIDHGRRVNSTMINNSAAWQQLSESKTSPGSQNSHQMLQPLHFFWDKSQKKPTSLLSPDTPNTWVWPGDAACIEDKLYIFLNLIRRKPGDSSCWGFEAAGHELLKVDNPLAVPTSWRTQRIALPAGFEFGNAVLVDGDYLYAYGEYPAAAQELNKHPIVLARIDRTSLAKLDNAGWQFWCQKSGENRWSHDLTNPLVLIPDGAPEMTVSRIRGFSGFFATYSLPGLSSKIVVRHSETPQGPWSASILVYTCPSGHKGTFVYNAKAHTELARDDGELIITYCENADSMDVNRNEPQIYAPKGVMVRLQRR